VFPMQKDQGHGIQTNKDFYTWTIMCDSFFNLHALALDFITFHACSNSSSSSSLNIGHSQLASTAAITWSRCSSLNHVITAAMTSLVLGSCMSSITDGDNGVPEDDTGVIEKEDHEGIHDMVEKDVLEEDSDILENEDYKEISNVTEKNIKRKFTRESREDSEEESVIRVVMSGEQQQGLLMLLTGSVNYIYSYTKILNLTGRREMTAIIQGCW